MFLMGSPLFEILSQESRRGGRHRRVLKAHWRRARSRQSISAQANEPIPLSLLLSLTPPIILNRSQQKQLDHDCQL